MGAGVRGWASERFLSVHTLADAEMDDDMLEALTSLAATLAATLATLPAHTDKVILRFYKNKSESGP